MNAKACPDCGKIFHHSTKWVLHHSEQMCRQKKARLRGIREEQLIADILDGKRGYDARKIRRY